MNDGWLRRAIVVCALGAVACTPKGKDGSVLPRALHTLASDHEISRATVPYSLPGTTLWHVTAHWKGQHDYDPPTLLVAVTKDGKLLQGKELFLALAAKNLDAAVMAGVATYTLDTKWPLNPDEADNFDKRHLALVRAPEVKRGVLEYWGTGSGLAYGIVTRIRVDLATGQVNEQGAPTILRNQEYARLADDILEQRAVAHAIEENITIWSTSADFEGYGTTTIYERVGNSKPKDLAEFEIGDDTFRPQRDKAYARLRKRLDESTFISLAKHPWELGETRLLLPGMSLALSWHDRTLVLESGGGQRRKLQHYTIEDPHRPRPTAIYASPGASVIVAEITYDPGEAYQDGFTVWTMVDAFPLHP